MTFASQRRKRRRPKPAAHSGSRNVPGARWLALQKKYGFEIWMYDKDPNAEKIRPSLMHIDKPNLAYPKRGRGYVFCWHNWGHYWFTHEDAKL